MTRSTRSVLMSCAAVAAILSLALGPAAAEGDEDTEAMASMEPMMEMEPGLHVMHAWARPSPMMDLAGAAYMVIYNNTDVDDALIGASSPASEVAELHLSSMDAEGMMSMEPVSEIALPAHAEAELKPGSYHIMLIDLVAPLEVDGEVEISLEFLNAEPQTVVVPVMAEAPSMDGMDMDHEMGDMDHEMGDMDHEMGDMDEDAEDEDDEDED